MCKTPKQIVDDFFFEYGGIEPDPVPDEFDRFKNLNLDELNELASFGIGLRIGLRTREIWNEHFPSEVMDDQK